MLTELVFLRIYLGRST